MSWERKSRVFRILVTVGVSSVAGFVGSLGCSSDESDDSGVGGAGGTSAFDPYDKSLVELSEALEQGKTSSAELVEHYLARIAAYDDDGPQIQAITRLNPSLSEEVDAADERREEGEERSSLDGIPIVLKENIDVVGMPTTAGSVALESNFPERDAEVVTKLRDAGVIVLGKTNMSEFAASYGRLGYSSAGGQTYNPVNLDRNASGSSSGSAAAVAADFAPMALGTDTSGSVRGPAASVGAVGVRATLGAVSIEGVVPLSTSFDVVGPITRTAAGAALLLSILGDDFESVNETVEDAVEGLRLGVIRQFSSGNSEVADALEATVDVLESQDATVVEVTLSDELAYAWTPLLGPLGELDLVHDIDTYLAGANEETPGSVEEVVEVLQSPDVTSLETPPNESRVNGLVSALEESDLYGEEEYERLVEEVRPALVDELEGIMEDEQLDAIVLPTMECPASPIDYDPDPTWECESYDEYAPSYVAPATGYPEVTVPVAIDSVGLPIGISVLGPPASEGILLQIAARLQEATRAEAETPSTPPL